MMATATRLRIALCAALVLAASLAAAAQDSPVRVLVGMTQQSGYSEIDGFDHQQGFSLGLEYLWAPRWAAGLRSTLDGYARSGSGEDREAYSLDLAAHYYAYRGSKWALFSAAGLRYAESDFGFPSTAGSSATGVLIGLGTDFSFSRRFSLRLDATAVPFDLGGSSERLEGVSFGVGLGYRF